MTKLTAFPCVCLCVCVCVCGGGWMALYYFIFPQRCRRGSNQSCLSNDSSLATLNQWAFKKFFFFLLIVQKLTSCSIILIKAPSLFQEGRNSHKHEWAQAIHRVCVCVCVCVRIHTALEISVVWRLCVAKENKECVKCVGWSVIAHLTILGNRA